MEGLIKAGIGLSIQIKDTGNRIFLPMSLRSDYLLITY